MMVSLAPSAVDSSRKTSNAASLHAARLARVSCLKPMMLRCPAFFLIRHQMSRMRRSRAAAGAALPAALAAALAVRAHGCKEGR